MQQTVLTKVNYAKNTVNEEVFLTELEIKEKIKNVAEKIALFYNDKPGEILLLIVLKGAFLFGSDLMKELSYYESIHDRLTVDFIKVKSRPSDNEILSNISVQDFDFNVLNKKHVLIVEDIIDTGNSIKSLLEIIGNQAQPTSVEITCLLYNPEHKNSHQDLSINFITYTMDKSAFVYGFGMDSNELLRGKEKIYFINDR